MKSLGAWVLALACGACSGGCVFLWEAADDANGGGSGGPSLPAGCEYVSPDAGIDTCTGATWPSSAVCPEYADLRGGECSCILGPSHGLKYQGETVAPCCCIASQ